MDEARKEIESIDKEMAALFEKRMKCSNSIARYKIEHGLPVVDKERERLLIDKNVGYIEDNSLEPYYREFFNFMLKVSKNYQQTFMRSVKVAYSGIEGSFASIMASNIFPAARRIACKSFANAYETVEKGECDFVVLPIENSYAGEVGQVTDIMFNGSLYVNGVYELGVNQCLLGVEGSSISSIRTVVSHPQALEQCNEYIYDHEFRIKEAENTAVAARDIADRNDITVGAIASAQTAELYNLKVLDHNINKSQQNTTRFAVMSRTREDFKTKDNSVCSILMFTVKNEAGTLAKAVSIIGEYGFNMNVLRSRPIKVVNWKYYFYAELEGDITSEIGTQMIEKLAGECEVIKVIGAYKPGGRFN